MKKSLFLLILASANFLIGCSQQVLPDATNENKPRPTGPTKSVMLRIDKATGKPIN